ncbi:MAG: LpqB family beta-propeller domain-containing protein [Dermatophilaceae bacterium]
MSRWRVLAALAMALVVVAVGFGGCSGLPHSSDVLAGRNVDERVAAPARVIVPPPTPGASIEAVALGFVRAGPAFQQADNQEPVGRSYLEAASVDRWRPTSQVVVYDRDASLVATPVSPTQVKVSTQAVAVVDASGRYRELAPQTPVETVFNLVQVDGEWRVSLPESGFGIWVNTDDFGLLFDAYAVSFPVMGGRRLVPDVRWFATGPRLLTALARAQLGAIPEYLSGAVETGVPDGTRLAVDAVALQDQTATVVLSSAANTSDVQRRRAMWAQFAATLTQVPGVSGVRLEVQGIGRMVVPDQPDVVTSPDQAGYNTVALSTPRSGVLRTGERLTRVDLTRLDAIEAEPGAAAATGGKPELPNIPASLTGLAMSADGSDLAAVSADASALTRWHGTVAIPVDGVGTGLTRPAYEGQSRVWVAGLGSDGAARVWWADTTGGSEPARAVTASWLEGRVPLSVSVSRDGTRLALITRAATGGDTRLDVSGIIRDPSGAPTALAKGYRQAEPLTRLVDSTWIDQRTMAVLGALGDTDGVRVFTVDIGQGVGLRRVGLTDPALALGTPVAGARALVAAGGNRGFAVMTSAPSVVVRAGSTWRRLGAATELAIPPAP